MYSAEVDESLISGEVAPGFEEVEAEFERNFTERDELGAACVIYLRGEKVVDLWGGHRDEKTLAPWEEDTLTQVFSIAVLLATKHGLHDRGW